MGNKICHITSAHERYDTRVMQKECVSLVKDGHEVILVVNDSQCDETYKGVEIVSTKYMAKSRLRRFFISHKKIYKLAKNIDADLYHIHDPDLLPMALRFLRKGKLIVFDSHEDYPINIASRSWIPRPLRRLVAKGYELYERRAASKFSAIIATTPHITDRFRKFNENSYTVTNYPILTDYRPIDRSGIRAIGYAGHISPGYSQLQILEALSSLGDVQYIIAGKFSEEYREIMSISPVWNQVSYRGEVYPWEVKEVVYNNIAVGMCVQNVMQFEGRGTLGVNKLFEFWEQGIPVICSDYPLWIEIIDKYDCGIYVNSEDISAIRNAIHYLLDNPKRAMEMGSNGRKAVEEKYNWATQEQILISMYKNFAPTEHIV